MAEIIIDNKEIEKIIKTDKAITGLDEAYLKFIQDMQKGKQVIEQTAKSNVDIAKKASQYAKMLNKASESNNKLLQNTKQLEAQQKALASTTAKLNVSKTQTNKKLIEQRAELQKTNKEIKQQIIIQNAQKGSLRQIETSLAKNIEKYKNLSAAERANNKIGGQLLSTIKKQDKAVKDLNGELGRSQGHVGNYGKALQGVGKNLIGALGVVGGITAFVSVLKGAFRTIANFDQAQATLAATLGKTKDDIQDLTESSMRLGVVTEFSATQVSQLQNELAKLGFASTEIKAATPAILDFASATGADLAQAASVAGGAVRAFGLAASETNRVASALAVSTTKSALSFGDFSTIIGTVGPIANKYGLQIEDTIAVLGKLRDANFDASSASTAFRNILLKLSDPSSNLSKRFGGAATTSEELFRRLKVLKDEGEDLAGILELTDVRAAGAFATMIENVDGVNNLKTAITGVNDELADMVETKTDNVIGASKRLGSAWEGLVLRFRESSGVFAGVLDSLANVINTQANENINSWKKVVEAATLGIVNLAGKEQARIENMSKKLQNATAEEIRFSIEKNRAILENGDKTDRFLLKMAEDRLKELEEAEIASQERIAKQQEEAATQQAAQEKKALEERAKEYDIFAKKVEENIKKIKITDPISIDDVIVSPDEEDFNFDVVSEEDEARFNAIMNERAIAIEREAMLIRSTSKTKEEESERLLELDKRVLQEQLDSINKLVESETLSETRRIELKQEAANIQLQIDNMTTDQELANLEKVAKKREDIQKALIDVTKQFFAFRLESIRAEQSELEAQKEQGLITEKEFARKSAEIQLKEAKARRLSALFEIAVNTAVAVTQNLANPILAVATGVAGALQAAAVLAQPLPTVPAFAKGTDNAPSSFVAGEEKRELMQLSTGKLMMVDKPTYFEGNQFKGAKIFTNKETEYIMSRTASPNFSGSSFSDERMVGELKAMRKDIKKIQRPIVSKTGKQIGWGNSNHFEIRFKNL